MILSSGKLKRSAYRQSYCRVYSTFVYALMARWIFRVDTNTRYNKMQVDLLAAMAKQQGIPVEQIYHALGLKVPKTNSTP